MNIEILKEFGLNNKEIEVYITLVKEGELNASEIASFTKINRTTVYLELENLIRKGLVNSVIKKSKKFNAASPEKLLDILEEQKRQTTDLIKELNLMKKSLKQSRIQHYSGIEGVKNLYLDILNDNKDVNIFGGTGLGFKAFKYYYPQIYRKIENLNMKARMIVNFGTEDEFEHYYKKYNAKIKYMPKEFPSKVTTVIYGNKVAIQSLQKDNIYFLLIEDKNLVESYLNNFDFMWENLK